MVTKHSKRIITIKHKNKVYKAKLTAQTNTAISFYVFNFNKVYTIPITSQTITPAYKTTLEQKQNANTITSPLCGKVTQINVTKNQFVKKNETLLTIESMKMENEIRATCDSFI